MANVLDRGKWLKKYTLLCCTLCNTPISQEAVYLKPDIKIKAFLLYPVKDIPADKQQLWTLQQQLSNILE